MAQSTARRAAYEPPPNETQYCVAILPGEGLSAADQVHLDGRKAALLNDFRWQGGNTIRIKFIGGSAALRARVRKAAGKWIGKTMANLQFSWLDLGDSDVRIDFVPGKGSWSVVGTMCQHVDPAKATMNFGWLTDDSTDEAVSSVVLHEFGHALGLIHEHQNPNHAIEWNKPAVIEDLSGPPNSWDLAKIEHNLFEKYDPADVTATPVDKRSIMLYPIPAAWTLDGFSAGVNPKLSRTDRKFIRQAYPFI